MHNIVNCGVRETTWGSLTGCAGRLPHIPRLLACIALMLVVTGCRAPGDKVDRSRVADRVHRIINTLARTAPIRFEDVIESFLLRMLGWMACRTTSRIDGSELPPRQSE